MNYACKHCGHAVDLRWGKGASRWACNNIFRDSNSVLEGGILRSDCDDRHPGEPIVVEISVERALSLDDVKEEHDSDSEEYRDAVRVLALEANNETEEEEDNE